MRKDLEECGGVLLHPHTFAVLQAWPIEWASLWATVETIAAARLCARKGLEQRIHHLP